MIKEGKMTVRLDKRGHLCFPLKTAGKEFEIVDQLSVRLEDELVQKELKFLDLLLRKRKLRRQTAVNSLLFSSLMDEVFDYVRKYLGKRHGVDFAKVCHISVVRYRPKGKLRKIYSVSVEVDLLKEVKKKK